MNMLKFKDVNNNEVELDLETVGSLHLGYDVPVEDCMVQGSRFSVEIPDHWDTKMIPISLETYIELLKNPRLGVFSNRSILDSVG